MIFESTLTKKQIELIGSPNLETVSLDATCSESLGL